MSQNSKQAPRQKVSRGDLLRTGVRAVPLFGAAVFARHFLKAPYAVPLVPGHYDSDSQLYVSDETGKPVLVADCKSPVGCLSCGHCQVVTTSGTKASPDRQTDNISDHCHVDH